MSANAQLATETDDKDVNCLFLSGVQGNKNPRQNNKERGRGTLYYYSDQSPSNGSQ